MSSWFVKDGNKCNQFWVTRDEKSFAASGMADDTEEAKTGCK